MTRHDEWTQILHEEDSGPADEDQSTSTPGG